MPSESEPSPAGARLSQERRRPDVQVKAILGGSRSGEIDIVPHDALHGMGAKSSRRAPGPPAHRSRSAESSSSNSPSRGRFDRFGSLASHRHFIERRKARLRAERLLDAQGLV